MRIPHEKKRNRKETRKNRLTGRTYGRMIATMNTPATRKTTPPTAPAGDWHPADIVAALRKQGWSLRRLSVHHGYQPTGLANALGRPYPRAERLVAEAIGVPPETIWPSRYAQRAERAARRSALTHKARRSRSAR